jgi:hypothetical protein
MTRIKEGYLVFEFGDKWRVLKFDEHPDYENISGIVNGTKGVDFIGIFNEKTLYFIEVKDFREDIIKIWLEQDLSKNIFNASKIKFF